MLILPVGRLQFYLFLLRVGRIQLIAGHRKQERPRSALAAPRASRPFISLEEIDGQLSKWTHNLTIKNRIKVNALNNPGYQRPFNTQPIIVYYQFSLFSIDNH